MQLTAQQQRAIDQIEEFVKSDASVFILTGYAGTGKTTVLKQVADHLIPAKTLFPMAPTGRDPRKPIPHEGADPPGRRCSPGGTKQLHT